MVVTRSQAREHRSRILSLPLPTELRISILEPLIRVPVSLTASNTQEMVDRYLTPCLDPWRCIGENGSIKDDLIDFFWTYNAVKLQPLPNEEYYTPNLAGKIEDKALRLPIPPPFVREMKKRVEFHAYGIENCGLGHGDASKVTLYREIAARLDFQRRKKFDTWHHLRAVTNGEYGFKALDHVDVYFEVDPEEIWNFTQWLVHVPVRTGVVIVDVQSKGWEVKLRNALRKRQRLWWRLRRDITKPGFVLIKKEQSVQKGKENESLSVEALDEMMLDDGDDAIVENDVLDDEVDGEDDDLMQDVENEGLEGWENNRECLDICEEYDKQERSFTAPRQSIFGP